MLAANVGKRKSSEPAGYKDGKALCAEGETVNVANVSVSLVCRSWLSNAYQQSIAVELDLTCRDT